MVPTAVVLAGFLIPPVPTREFQWQDVVEPVTMSADRRSDTTPFSVMEGGWSACPEPVVSKADALKTELLLYGGLLDGWDGPDSVGASEATVIAATTFIDAIPAGLPLPKPMLSSSGELGLYWDTDSTFADISFEAGDTFSLFARDKRSGKEWFIDGQRIAEIETKWFDDHMQHLFAMEA